MGAAKRGSRLNWTAAGVRTLVLLPLLLLVGARAGEFEDANALFDQGKVTEAKAVYEKLIENGEGSANVFYNLGNADFRLGAEGRAMLNYERALALAPRHPEARANLKLLRERSGAKLPTVPWWKTIFTSQPLTHWVVAATAAVWVTLFAVVLLATSLRSGNGGLWFLTIAGVAVAAVAGTGVWFGWKGAALGIITAKQTEARLAPAASAGVAEALPAGGRVRVLSERGAWIYCELPGAGRGWVPSGTLERVSPGRS